MTISGQDRRFLGQGRGVPLGIDQKGKITLSRNEHDISEAIKIILSTAHGEWKMRPEFGSALHEFVFAPNNATTAGMLAYHVEEALARWEARIDVTEVDVRPGPLDYGVIQINIKYSIKATNHEVNMVYPFYLIPAEV